MTIMPRSPQPEHSVSQNAVTVCFASRQRFGNPRNAPAAGYVALLTVLIVGATSLVIASALLITGTDSQRSTLSTQQANQANSLASACAEEALQQMNADTAYTGSGNLTISPGSCTYTVTNNGGSNRTITTTGIVNNVTRKQQVYATINATNISVSSWQDVP